jgi:hypothetical protein
MAKHKAECIQAGRNQQSIQPLDGSGATSAASSFEFSGRESQMVVTFDSSFIENNRRI